MGGVLTIAAVAQQKTNSLQQQLDQSRVRLPNGWHLSPAGSALPLGDLPLNMAVSPNGKLLAATNNGQSVQSIQLIDVTGEKIISNVVIPKSWYGLAFSADGKSLYASGGNDNRILIYSVANSGLQLKDSISLGKPWPNRISPAGIAVDNAMNRLYVATKDNNSLYIIDLATKQINKTIPLASEAYSCLLSPDKKQLYISLWGADKVAVFDTKQETLVGDIAVGDNPNEMLLTRNGSYLYVANANDNSVSVIETKTRKVLEVLNAALYPSAPEGTTSNGLALSSDEKTLYVANADNNCLAVFDVSKRGFAQSKGFIPTGWYPTNVKVIGKKIYVSNGKGFSSFANPNGPSPIRPRGSVVRHAGDSTAPKEVEYIGGLMKGTLSIIPQPNEQTLATYSKAVYENTPYSKDGELNAPGEAGNPVPMKVGDASPVKYVFYIIKENRTYDQVLSDISGGNGDTSLLLFGRHVTPNLHKIAEEFVLLDNFYADGEVSADGHNWSTSAHATDYLEKNWPSSYGGRGGDYPGEGKKKVANPKRGFIWDFCQRAGVSYRTYGEFADDGKPNIPSLEGHLCPYYADYNLSVRDTTRFGQWRHEFDSLLAKNAVPRFNSIRFGNDHTEGLRTGRPSPFAHVADNDLACGLFLEYLSNSPIWKESAVFIVEDDAQNGPDHVDAHRTTAYVAGPFVKRKFVDHTMYSTSSMLRTMELILGLPPMSQYDAAAMPMWRSFTAKPDHQSFRSVAANVDLNEKNTANNATAALSNTLDFRKEDTIPDLLFSTIIWKAVKGENSVMPAPRRSSFLKVKKEEEGDDDD